MSSEKTFAQQAPGATGVDPNHPAAAHAVVLDGRAGRTDLLRGRKKFGICGFASSSRHLIPVDDPEWVIGGMNQLYRHIGRADYWCDIHANWEDGNVEGTDHPKWLAECGIPVYMVDPPAYLPTGVRFPIERFIAKFGVDYFTSSVSYLVALAIDQIDEAVQRRAAETLAAVSTNGHAGASVWDAHQLVRSLYAEYTIGIFGIDLIVGDEYDFQKACAEFWIGMANARGIQIFIPPQSALCKQRWRYGYQSEPATGLIALSDLQARNAELKKQAQAAHDQFEQLRAKLTAIDGALQENQHITAVLDLRTKGGFIAMAGH
jgi:hypothetical protein